MSGKTLIPQTANPPAKVKDPGIIHLVKAGAAAYNAKTGTLLLLPEGEKERKEITSRIRESLFDTAGVQQVDCGGDTAIFSVAERYVKDWGDAATAFSEERGREIHLLGWCKDIGEAMIKMGEIQSALLDTLSPKGNFTFVEEISECHSKTVYLASPAEPGTLEPREGFICRSCGQIYLPDSPIRFNEVQPGAQECEEALEEIETPGADTIPDLCNQLGIDAKRTLKAMLYVAFDETQAPRPIAAFVRGDRNISMAKLASCLLRHHNLRGLRTAEKTELRELVGEVAGYCGPVGMPDHVILICDESAKDTKNVVVGANRPGYHKKGCCYGRDFEAPAFDIAQNSQGISCSCGATSLEAVLLRISGVINFGVGLKKKTDGNSSDEKIYKVLSCKNREGVCQYATEWNADFSVEKIILAIHSG